MKKSILLPVWPLIFLVMLYLSEVYLVTSISSYNMGALLVCIVGLKLMTLIYMLTNSKQSI